VTPFKSEEHKYYISNHGVYEHRSTGKIYHFNCLWL